MPFGFYVGPLVGDPDPVLSLSVVAVIRLLSFWQRRPTRLHCNANRIVTIHPPQGNVWHSFYRMAVFFGGSSSSFALQYIACAVIANKRLSTQVLIRKSSGYYFVYLWFIFRPTQFTVSQSPTTTINDLWSICNNFGGCASPLCTSQSHFHCTIQKTHSKLTRGSTPHLSIESPWGDETIFN